MADAPFPGGGDGVTGRPVLGPHDLSGRQLQVLDLLGQGCDMPVVSKRMGISVHTARGYLKAAMERLDAANSTQAVAVATHRKLIPLNPQQCGQPYGFGGQ